MNGLTDIVMMSRSMSHVTVANLLLVVEGPVLFAMCTYLS